MQSTASTSFEHPIRTPRIPYDEKSGKSEAARPTSPKRLPASYLIIVCFFIRFLVLLSCFLDILFVPTGAWTRVGELSLIVCTRTLGSEVSATIGAISARITHLDFFTI